MTVLLRRAGLLTLLVAVMELICFQSAMASDELRQSSRIGALRIPLTSYERIPIGTVLAHPDHYQMREIRLSGTIMAMHTKIVTNRMICGLAHEQTVLTVEDNGGQIQVIDLGACGKNLSALKAPMVKVGEQVDLLVQIMVTKHPESREAVLETTIRFLDRVRY